MPEKLAGSKAVPNRWFRFYSECLDDPKVQRLQPHLFKTWVNLLCLACTGSGDLPSRDDIAFRLRLSPHEAASQIDELISLALIDIQPDGSLAPHNWSARQFTSDRSTERVRKHREKHKKDDGNVSRNVSVTAQKQKQSRTDSESEIESRASQPAARESAAMRLDLRALSDRLFDAAGPALASEAIAPGLASMATPAMWLDQGADLELDVIETLRAHAAKRRGVMSWDYFTRPVAEAKARRLAGLPAITASPDQPRKSKIDWSKFEIVNREPSRHVEVEQPRA